MAYTNHGQHQHPQRTLFLLRACPSCPAFPDYCSCKYTYSKRTYILGRRCIQAVQPWQQHFLVPSPRSFLVPTCILISGRMTTCSTRCFCLFPLVLESTSTSCSRAVFRLSNLFTAYGSYDFNWTTIIEQTKRRTTMYDNHVRRGHPSPSLFFLLLVQTKAHKFIATPQSSSPSSSSSP